MDYTEFTLRIFIIFIPGVITQTIIENLTYAKKSDLQEFVSKSLMYGFINYYLYYLISLMPILQLGFSFTDAVLDDSSSIDFKEIFIGAGIGVLTGIILSFLINSGATTRGLSKLKLTHSVGPQDVWMTTIGSREYEWLRIRNRSENIIYEGRVKLYSELDGLLEILLLDVIAYRNSDNGKAQELWDVESLYLCLKKENAVVEFPSPSVVVEANDDVDLRCEEE
jgi:hypothetical protein